MSSEFSGSWVIPSTDSLVDLDNAQRDPEQLEPSDQYSETVKMCFAIRSEISRILALATGSQCENFSTTIATHVYKFVHSSLRGLGIDVAGLLVDFSILTTSDSGSPSKVTVEINLSISKQSPNSQELSSPTSEVNNNQMFTWCDKSVFSDQSSARA